MSYNTTKQIGGIKTINTNKGDFSGDLSKGKLGEAFMQSLFSYDEEGNKVFNINPIAEVKTEYTKWFDSGNIYVEYECSGKPSGYKVSECDIFCVVFKDENDFCDSMSFNAQKFKQFMKREYENKNVKGIRGGDAGKDGIKKCLGYLVPMHKLPSIYREKLERESVSQDTVGPDLTQEDKLPWED